MSNIFAFVFICSIWISGSYSRTLYQQNPNYYQAQSAPIYRNYRQTASSTQTRNTPSQQRTMVFHGYYAQPVLRSSPSIPEGAMTAFAAGETVATGTAYLPPQAAIATGCKTARCPDYIGNVDSESPQKNIAPIAELQPPNNVPEIIEEQDDLSNQIPLEPESITEQVSSEEQPPSPAVEFSTVKSAVSTLSPAVASQTTVATTTATAAKTPSSKRRHHIQIDDEDEDENDGYSPFNGGRRQFPIYNSFFPMMFGGGGGARGFKHGSNGDDGAASSYPGGATAIANSFSTGKGGVATSHATAYGGPRP